MKICCLFSRFMLNQQNTISVKKIRNKNKNNVLEQKLYCVANGNQTDKNGRVQTIEGIDNEGNV